METIIKRFTIRLLPNEEQESLLWKHIHGSRFVWNYTINLLEEKFKNGEGYLSAYSTRKILLALRKENEDYFWLQEIAGHTIGLVCSDLNKSYQKFFKKKSGHPQFKKKGKSKTVYPVRSDNLYFKDGCANIEKVGKVKYKTNFNLPNGKGTCKFYDARIVFMHNKWLLVFGMECENQTQHLNTYSMGIDLGITELAVVAYGENCKTYANINKSKKVQKLKSKLKHLSRKVDRKYETNNKNKVYEDKWYKSKAILKTE